MKNLTNSCEWEVKCLHQNKDNMIEFIWIPVLCQFRVVVDERETFFIASDKLGLKEFDYPKKQVRIICLN